MKQVGKIVALVLIATLCLVGCTGNTKTTSTDAETSNYPERSINIINPYAPGGNADLQARILAQYMQEELGQTVNIVTKQGGAGAVGMNELKKAKPDGYNIIISATGPATLTPNHSDVGYNTVEDFEAISQISRAYYGIAVHKDSKINTLDELLAYIKANPDKATYGTGGAGLHQHVLMTQLFSMIPDANMEHIPFNGGAESVSALLGEHVSAICNSVPELYPHYQAGTFKLLAVTSEERLDEFPDVPTLKELGYEGISAGAWLGFLAPKDTPEEIIQALDETVQAGLMDPAIIEQFKKAGIAIEYQDHAAFAQTIANDWDINGELIKEMNAN